MTLYVLGGTQGVPCVQAVPMGASAYEKGSPLLLCSLPVVSAFLISACFAPHDLCFLAWVGLAPLFYGLRQRGILVAGGFASLFGFLFCIGAFSWVNALIRINLADFFLMVVIFGLYFFFFGIAYGMAARNIGSWMVLCAPALWVTMEYIRSNLGFIAWPWNLLGHSQYRCLPIIQIADITGVYGVSFLIVMTNQLLSQTPEFVDGLKRSEYFSRVGSYRQQWILRQLMPLVLALGFSMTYGWFKLTEPENDHRIRVALVQPNLIAGDGMRLAEQAEHMRVYSQLSSDAARQKPDLIVWPSSSLPAPLNFSRLVRYHVMNLARATGSYLLVGGAGHDKVTPKQDGYQPYSNSEFLISPKGQVEGQYNKMRLLPFNEYLPIQRWIKWPKWITSLQSSFLPGETHTLFQLPGVRFGTPICWENLFPDLFSRFVKDGANFMVSASNDGFMGDTPGPHQTMAMTVFRAVENKVAVVRTTTTGVSGFIGPCGDIVETVRNSEGKEVFVSGFLVRDIPLSGSKTFYTDHGDLFALIILCMSIVTIIGCLASERWMSFRSRR